MLVHLMHLVHCSNFSHTAAVTCVTRAANPQTQISISLVLVQSNLKVSYEKESINYRVEV